MKCTFARLFYLDCLWLIGCLCSHQKALWYAVGNTLMTDSLDEARNLAYGKRLERTLMPPFLVLLIEFLYRLSFVTAPGNERKYKIITIKGQVIHRTGNMTGGSAPDLIKQASIWDEKEVDHLKEQKTKLFKVSRLFACSSSKLFGR